ncbi:MAG: putative sulfate exporter family transporter [Crocinitomicaceae bacterium]|nr:putative sulfate exporter family transporter [Crocinitomicaceae bacterium]
MQVITQIKIAKTNPKLVKVAFVCAIIVCLSTFVSSPIALIGGFLFSYFLGHPFLHLNHKAVSWLLKIAVMGLGFGMSIQGALNAGKEGFALTVFSIFFTLLIGFLIGFLLKISKKTSLLISSGTAICGGSAIAAISPVINASEKDIAVALGVVFLLNSIALLVFPSIGHLFNLTEHQFGLWSAIAIHDTSSVVGAAHAYGDEALKVATTVKLARALWIIPVSILSIFLFKGNGNSIKIPWFIFLFIGVIILNSYFHLPELITSSITGISKSILVLTLFLIGAGLSIDKIKTAGWKPMILGVSLWGLISIISLFIIIMM